MTNDFRKLLAALQDGGVEFIVIGGMAATAHGSAHHTLDVDIVYRRTPENIARLVRTLDPLGPYLRGAPPGLPFTLDEATVRRGLNFTLTTRLGLLDTLGEVTGGGGYDDLLPHTVEIELFGLTLSCLDLPTLIRVKRAAGRPKDFERVAELESILGERRGG